MDTIIAAIINTINCFVVATTDMQQQGLHPWWWWLPEEDDELPLVRIQAWEDGASFWGGCRIVPLFFDFGFSTFVSWVHRVFSSKPSMTTSWEVERGETGENSSEEQDEETEVSVVHAEIEEFDSSEG